MSTSREGSAATLGAPAATLGAPATSPAGHPSGFPVCRCGHPTHPDRLESRRGVMMERYSCPRRRWWNPWLHPNLWLTPRD
jgi:hypothetical protein